MNRKGEKKVEQKTSVSCETCMYFDYDEAYQEEICTMDMDEDEMERLAAGRYSSCPYYRFYDEYKFVQKQN